MSGEHRFLTINEIPRRIMFEGSCGAAESSARVEKH